MSISDSNVVPFQRTGYSVSEPRDGEPDWVPRARELRQRGWTFKRICADVDQRHATVHGWVSPGGDATKRKPKGYFTQTGTCEECGAKFKASPSSMEAGRKFCSRKCFHAKGRRSEEGTKAASRKMRAQRMGKANPAYRHGKHVGFKTKEIEREFNIAKKGEKCCRVCGSDFQLSAHHAVPRSLSPAGRADLRNCLPLCSRCHASWHRGKAISREHFTADEWAFIETLIGPGWLDKRYPKADEMRDGYHWDDSSRRAA